MTPLSLLQARQQKIDLQRLVGARRQPVMSFFLHQKRLSLHDLNGESRLRYVQMIEQMGGQVVDERPADYAITETKIEHLTSKQVNPSWIDALYSSDRWLEPSAWVISAGGSLPAPTRKGPQRMINSSMQFVGGVRPPASPYHHSAPLTSRGAPGSSTLHRPAAQLLNDPNSSSDDEPPRSAPNQSLAKESDRDSDDEVEKEPRAHGRLSVDMLMEFSQMPDADVDGKGAFNVMVEKDAKKSADAGPAGREMLFDLFESQVG